MNLPVLETVLRDVKAAARAEECEVVENPGTPSGQFEVEGKFKEKKEKNV